MKKQLKINLKMYILLSFIMVILIGLFLTAKIKTENNYIELSEVTEEIRENDKKMANEIEKDNAIKKQKREAIIEKENAKKVYEEESSKVTSYNVTEEDISDFTFSFLKIENQRKNKIYSPIFIMNSLKTLESISDGETKAQISKLIGNNQYVKYKHSNNFISASTIFLKNDFKSRVNDKTVTTLNKDYKTEVNYLGKEYQSPAVVIEEWVEEASNEKFSRLFYSGEVENSNALYLNLVAISKMRWKEEFMQNGENQDNAPIIEFFHEKRAEDFDTVISSSDNLNEVEGIDVYATLDYTYKDFNNEIKTTNIPFLEVNATINNYDIVKELGEEKIKQTVEKEYRNIVNRKEYDLDHVRGDVLISEDRSESVVKKDLENYLTTYISEINSNYHKAGASTEFSFYTDEDVNVFEKDVNVNQYDNLQFVAIMPKNENLNSFIEKINTNKVENYISKLKEIKTENFKEGVVTKIKCYIPDVNFDFDSQINLKRCLTSLGVTNIFNNEKSKINNLVNEGNIALDHIIHKSQIDLQTKYFGGNQKNTQEDYSEKTFDYKFDVPTEEINIIFDKPFMFLIRDEKTGDIWFTGTIYSNM